MKRILKKEQGTAGIMDFLPIIIMIICGAFILIQSMYYIRYLNLYNKLENIAQRYVMIMETTNGLSTDDYVDLCSELEALGIALEDIVVEGTTFTSDDVDYGEEIYLKLNVKLPMDKILLVNGSKKIITEKKEVYIVKCTLALG